MDTKTPEQLAADYCEPILSDEYAREIGRKDWIGTRCVSVGEGHEMYKAFLAGYHAGVKEAEERILNEFFDNYGADEHASFALRVNAYQWNKNDK